MKKTVTANINGIELRIDEDAYEKLNRYLFVIRSYFSNSAERDEIMGDIEARIAEMFKENITATKSVITIADVENMIAVMGQPEAFAEGSDNLNESTSASFTTEKEEKQKRLFRDPDEKILGGVCSGVAAYFGIDPVWMRILFVASFFLYGTSFWIYIILWIIIPKAKTAADKLSMRGEPINIENISKTVNEGAENVKNKFNEMNEEAKSFAKSGSGNRAKNQFEKILAFLLHIFTLFAKAIIKLFGVALIFFSVFSLIAIIAATLFDSTSFFSINDNEIYTGGLYDVFRLVFENNFSFNLARLSFAIVSGIPVLSLLILGAVFLTGWKKNVRTVAIILFGTWIVGLFLSAIITIKTVKQFSIEQEVTQKTEFKPSAKDTLFVGANNQNEPQGLLMDFHIRDNQVFKMDDDNLYFYYPKIKIENSDDGKYYIKVEKNSRGSNFKAAKKNADEISFEWSSKDSLLLLNPYYSTPINNKFRNQLATIKIYVPKNVTVKFDESITKKFNWWEDYNYEEEYIDENMTEEINHQIEEEMKAAAKEQLEMAKQQMKEAQKELERAEKELEKKK